MQDQAAQQVAKQGPSKFDHAMKSQGVDHANKANAVSQVNQVQKAELAHKVEQIHKAEKANLTKVNGAAQQRDQLTAKAADPVAQKAEVAKNGDMLMGMMSNMEKGQVALDKLISAGVTGKNFSNSELLALQAGMYKYTQELELTGKVVEKATSGLKDTLKTQV